MLRFVVAVENIAVCRRRELPDTELVGYIEYVHTSLLPSCSFAQLLFELDSLPIDGKVNFLDKI